MFVKNLTVPINLLKAEALERRIDKNHPVLEELIPYIKSLRSGYHGEKTMNYYLRQIPDQRFYIFHDLRLKFGNEYFQIDVLLLSSKCIFLLDGKNHSGKLFIERNQMIQEYDDKRIIYENPILQANRHKLLLHYFFEENRIPQIPIESTVVICKSPTELLISPGYSEAEKKVWRAHNMLWKLEEQFHRYNQDRLDHKTLQKIKKLLLKSHTPPDTGILEKFGISKSEIITGVQCPICSFIPTIYKRNNWLCPKCQTFSPDAFHNGIKDYLLLINPSFINPEIRSFLHLPTSRIATHFLSVLNFPYTGTTKGRIYHQPKDFL